MSISLFTILAFAPLVEAISEHWDPPGLLLGKLAAIAHLVVLNGFFVACEFAIVKVRSSQLDALVEEGNRRRRSRSAGARSISMPISPRASSE